MPKNKGGGGKGGKGGKAEGAEGGSGGKQAKGGTAVKVNIYIMLCLLLSLIQS